MRPLPKLGIGFSIVATLLVVGGYTAGTRSASSRTHTYYIAADEITWDYAPTGLDQIKGRPFDAVERHFVEAGPHTVGKVTLKAMYRE